MANSSFDIKGSQRRSQMDSKVSRPRATHSFSSSHWPVCWMSRTSIWINRIRQKSTAPTFPDTPTFMLSWLLFTNVSGTINPAWPEQSGLCATLTKSTKMFEATSGTHMWWRLRSGSWYMAKHWWIKPEVNRQRRTPVGCLARVGRRQACLVCLFRSERESLRCRGGISGGMDFLQCRQGVGTWRKDLPSVRSAKSCQLGRRRECRNWNLWKERRAESSAHGSLWWWGVRSVLRRSR